MSSLGFPLASPLGGDPAVPDDVEAQGQVAIALSKVIEQYKAKPNFLALLRTFAAQTQDLDDANVALAYLTSIDDSEGAQLDNIGEKIGEPRLGFDDVTYRLHLKARVILNRGSGTTEDLLRLFVQLVGDGVTVTVHEEFPAAITLTLGGVAVDPSFAPYLVAFLAEGRAAGVKAILQWSDVAEAETFAFAGGTGKGFDDGSWASARYA